MRYSRFISGGRKLSTLTIAMVFVAATTASAVVPMLMSQLARAAAQASETVVVSADTAAGENQPGWLFGRDTNFATPFEFNTDAASIGEGSLYVLPISDNPADKFIAENFLLSPIAHVNSISYDFKIGSGGDASDANHFYMNVYANFGESDPNKFYDCRYDIVPGTGATDGFTSVTFDPSSTYPVAQSGSSPYDCPGTPASMDALSDGSTIRMFVLNVGDTSANDAGLDGYLDNVVVSKASTITTYDFEPDTTRPQVAITNVSEGDVIANDFTIEGTASDSQSGIDRVELRVRAIQGIGGGTIPGGSWMNPGDAAFDASSGTFSGSIESLDLGTGFYRLQARAYDKAGNDRQQRIDVLIDNTRPNVQITNVDEGDVISDKFTIKGTASDTHSDIDRVVLSVRDIESIGGSTVSGPDAIGWLHAGENIYNGDGTFEGTLESLNLEDGMYRLQARAYDTLGNHKPHRIDVHIKVTAPDVPTPINPDGDTNPFFTNAAFTQQWSNESATGAVKYEYLSCYQETEPATSECPDGVTTWTSAYTGTTKHVGGNQPDSHFFWHVRAVDAAGNKSDWSEWREIVIDSTKPTISLENVAVSADKKLSFDLTANDIGPAGLRHVAANIYDEHNETKVIELGSGNPTRLNTPHNGLPFGTPSFHINLSDIDVSGLPSDTYTIRSFARDHAGNERRFELAQFSIDNVAPTVEITAPAGGDTLSGIVDITGIVLDDVDLSHYNLSLYPGSTDLSDGGTHSGARINSLVGWDVYPSMVSVSGTNADVTRQLDTTLLDDGEYQIRLAARDQAGNRDTSNYNTGGDSSVHVITVLVSNTPEATPEPEVEPETGEGGVVESANTGTPNTTSSSVQALTTSQSQEHNQDQSQTGTTGNQNNQNENDTLAARDNQTANGQVQSESDNNNGADQDTVATTSGGFSWYWIPALLAFLGLILFAIKRKKHAAEE